MPEQNLHIYNKIAQMAQALGFGDFGCAKARRLDAEQNFYDYALEAGYFAEMSYLKRNTDKRFDPRLLVEGAESVLCFLVPYGKNNISVPTAGSFSAMKTVSAPRPVVSSYYNNTQVIQNLDSPFLSIEAAIFSAGRKIHPAPGNVLHTGENFSEKSGSLKISSYALGEDYHKVIKNKLYFLLQKIQEMAPGTRGRVFVDSAPVLERAWAARAGLGFIGKNNFLISRRCGIRNFIGIIITNLALPCTPAQEKNYCGSCTRCLESCPSGALCAPYRLDARKCISYQTIESRWPARQEPEQIFRDGWYFGCDACMNACPWNRKNKPGWEEFSTREKELSATEPPWWLEMAPEFFAARFRNSPLSRAGLSKIKDSVETCLRQEAAYRTTALPPAAGEQATDKTTVT